MLIDFCQYILGDSLVRFHGITLHTSLRLADITSGPFDSRDTILFQYTIDKGGRMRNASVIISLVSILKGFINCSE